MVWYQPKHCIFTFLSSRDPTLFFKATLDYWLLPKIMESGLPLAFRSQAVEGKAILYLCYLSRGHALPAPTPF